MRYLIFVSILSFFSCSKPFKDLQVVEIENQKGIPVLPSFEKALYRCKVEGRFGLKKFNLTGLLFFKNTHDSIQRVVFQNEMGMTYFDFSWGNREEFQVNYIIEMMDRPALILTLRKDLEMLLGRGHDFQTKQEFKGHQASVFRFDREKGFVYYFFNIHDQLFKIEHADEKQKIVSMDISIDKNNNLAERIFINHLRAKFTISLNKLESYAAP